MNSWGKSPRQGIFGGFLWVGRGGNGKHGIMNVFWGYICAQKRQIAFLFEGDGG